MQREQQQQQRPPPPAYIQHEPESLNLPSVPTHALPSPPQHNDRLPGIRSLDLPNASPAVRNASNLADLGASNSGDAMQWAALPPLNSATFPKVPDNIPRGGMDVDVGSPMDTGSVASIHDDAARRREASILSMDDDERAAAEALSGLGNPDYARSPASRSMTISRDTASAEPEPLLSLITSNHPWLGGTINGSISAYNTTKTYSPRFVKYGAELIERNIGSTVVNTVSSVGRRTGVEKNLRRYLGEVHRRPSDLEQGDSEVARKRPRRGSPKPTADAMDIDEAFTTRTRGGSHSSYAETLPAYDDQRSPKYEETVDTDNEQSTGEKADPETSQDRRVNWSTQLIMTTSGLGVALSDTSLRSLKICLSLLRNATTSIDSMMRALKLVLEEYESAVSSSQSDYPDEKALHRQDSDAAAKDAHVRQIANKMQALSTDIWQTLQRVVQSVSHYAGGALPQNASQVVRTQLLSIPQRWASASRTANEQRNGHGEQSQGAVGGRDEETAGGGEVRGANRMVAFAREGLDMIGQITTVVDGTVQSAEAWLDRMGRKNGGSAARESVNGDESAAGSNNFHQGFKPINGNGTPTTTVVNGTGKPFSPKDEKTGF
ncbi:Opi1-domain-containing protein [Aaosphaeria arxii CBS 175.79]|uniref:Opi1-domain-containing protein n=1 Tax=Aaosphaeria arxii CBS 175.79 TaxID=1450172 RepID=A0A6A5Y721_9PLEO|nr:Opi1-domain-containing protein [Aaosphaeria arxii CBS 175.79]KAF2021328.1 Opi1-domain-containing protein [Aaosphaeria arxii CBS 175.79]